MSSQSQAPVSEFLTIDPESETARITGFMLNTVRKSWRRGGAVLGISGGVDSSTVLQLCARAFGAQRVVALMLPEKDSSPDSEELARGVAASVGIEPIREDIAPSLAALGCYERRDAAVKRLFPSYDPAVHKMKIVLPSGLSDSKLLNVFQLAVVDPDGTEHRRRMPPDVYLEIVAASNMKQRTRALMIYHYAERHNYAVIGTANKDEHVQGFFVKYADGGVDLQPIMHLYKTQVYQLAAYLGVPDEVVRRPPTSDTYSAEVTQEEFFFRLPFQVMDELWAAEERGATAAEAARLVGLEEQKVREMFDDFARRRRTTEYLRSGPLMLSAAQAAPGTLAQVA